MKILGKKITHDFKQKHSDARSQLDLWEAEVEEARWDTPLDLKMRYPQASLLSNQQVIFDICNNKYRLWIRVNYKNQIVLIKKIGTHKEYNRWIIN